MILKLFHCDNENNPFKPKRGSQVPFVARMNFPFSIDTPPSRNSPFPRFILTKVTRAVRTLPSIRNPRFPTFWLRFFYTTIRNMPLISSSDINVIQLLKADEIIPDGKPKIRGKHLGAFYPYDQMHHHADVLLNHGMSFYYSLFRR